MPTRRLTEQLLDNRDCIPLHRIPSCVDQERLTLDGVTTTIRGLQLSESSTSGSSPRADELDATQSRIMQDPKLLATVLALQDDPDVLAVLDDAEITKAMAAGDYTALLNNPKIVALMHNAKMREIIDGVH